MAGTPYFTGKMRDHNNAVQLLASRFMVGYIYCSEMENIHTFAVSNNTSTLHQNNITDCGLLL
jgi:hypothetical protein